MKKNNSIQERIKSFTPLGRLIKEEEKDEKFRLVLDRARLRVSIARAIKTAREKANLTQEELAEAINTSQSVIGRLESLKDKRLPSLEILVKISFVTKRKIVAEQDRVHFELVANS